MELGRSAIGDRRDEALLETIILVKPKTVGLDSRLRGNDDPRQLVISMQMEIQVPGLW